MKIDRKAVDLGIIGVITYQAITAMPLIIFVVVRGGPTIEPFFWLALAWFLFVAASITGLLMRTRWGRILAMVHACFNLLAFPTGTIFGILILWYLRSPETQRRYFRFEPA